MPPILIEEDPIEIQKELFGLKTGPGPGIACPVAATPASLFLMLLRLKGPGLPHLLLSVLKGLTRTDALALPSPPSESTARTSSEEEPVSSMFSAC